MDARQLIWALVSARIQCEKFIAAETEIAETTAKTLNPEILHQGKLGAETTATARATLHKEIGVTHEQMIELCNSAAIEIRSMANRIGDEVPIAFFFQISKPGVN